MKRSPLRRAPMTRRDVDTGPAPEVVEAVYARATIDGWLSVCELCGDPVSGQRGVDFSLHHRRGRDGRSDSHTPANLMLVHGASNVDGCHGRIHRNREGESYAHGWLLSRNAKPLRDPAKVAVLIWRGARWVYLTPSGYAEHPEVTACP